MEYLLEFHQTIQYGSFKSLYPRQILSFGFRSKILGHPKKPPQMNPKMKKGHQIFINVLIYMENDFLKLNFDFVE